LIEEIGERRRSRLKKEEGKNENENEERGAPNIVEVECA